MNWKFNPPISLLASLRVLLLTIFYFLCLRQLIVFYNIIPQEDHVWFFLLISLFLLLAIYKRLWALYGIFVTVPLFTGLQVLHLVVPPIPVYSLLFSSFFLIWLPCRLLTRPVDLSPETDIGNLTDILAGIVICSLTVTLAPFCRDTIGYYLWIFSWEDFNQVLYTLESAFYLLQGLFFYRIAEKEFAHQSNFQKVIPIIIFQGVILIVFSLIQIIFGWPGKEYGFAVFSPFYDIHSFGSYIALVFFILLSLFLLKKNFFTLILCLSFFIFSIVSFSRATWAAILISGTAFLFFSTRKNKYLIIAVCSGIILLIGSVFSNYPSILFSSSYLNRFFQLLSLHQLNERLSLWKRAINIIVDFPITGSGIGTFYRHSVLYQDWDTTFLRDVHENAHNYYLQFSADLGLPALIILFSIFFYSFKIGFWIIPRDQQNGRLVKGILFGILAYLVTCLTGHPLILSHQQLLFWFLLALLVVPYRFLPDKLDFSGAYYKTKTWKIGLTVLLLIGYAPWIWGFNQRKPLVELGFYSDEFSGGTRYHWTTRKATTNILSKGSVLEYELRADPQFTQRKPQQFMLTVNGQPVDQRNFYYKDSRKYRFYLPPPKDGLLQIKSEVDQVVNFNRVGLNEDTRDLGVALSEFRFSDTVPEEGLGFYENALWTENSPEGWPSGVPLRYRWTALRASVKIPPSPKADLDLFVYATHPDISRKPVSVKVFGEEKLLREEPLSVPGWRKITLPARQLQDVKVLTFQADRVWNPKTAGVSDDTRDLGIAVAIP